VLTASSHLSLTYLSRRRARALFAVLTLALAVASVAFFAIPTLIDRAMQKEVAAERLADLSVALRPTAVTDEQLADLAALPNIEAVEPRRRVDVRILVGERRAPARIIAVKDFARQRVDIVRVDSGAPPALGEVLTEVQNANVGVYDGAAGDTVTVLSPGGRTPGGGAIASARLRVTGEGRSINGGEQVQDDDVVVLYATAATVSRLTGEPVWDRLAFRLDDPTPAAAAATAESVRSALDAVPGFTGLSHLPGVRAPGDWPGKEDTEQFAELLGVITLLALLSAVVLISNTMTTLVAEQTGEIGVMRAVGARRRQVALVYLRTALLLGLLGALAGCALGILLANGLAGYFGSVFWAVDVGFGVDGTVLFLSLLLGVLVPPAAALPSIRRAVRTDLRAALESKGSAVGTQDAGDRLLRGATFLPRTAQIGLRSVGQRKRRSLATIVIVALAVANLLAVLGIAASVTQATRSGWGDHLEDVQLSTGGPALFDERAARAIRSTPGVAEAEPVLKSTVDLGGEEAFVWGVEQVPLLRYRLSEGRWFSAAEEAARAPVVVIERNIAEIVGVDVGDRISLSTAAGQVPLRVVGKAKNQQEDGTALYVPLTTVRSVLDQPAGASAYWVRLTSQDEAFVDRSTTVLEDRLAALGHEVGTEITYVAEREEVAANRSLTTTIAVLGLVIVAMSMVGLANAITMSVLERTREIGVLRCIGARARDVRRIFASEGIALALAGWLLGIPLGYVLARLLVRLVWEIVDVRIPFAFPWTNVLIALAGTLVLGLVILLLPLRRAVRFRPGEALRYA
jgi:putative ABC transport system permease protein